MPRKAGQWLGGGLGYLLYGIGVLVVLLWLLFPKEAARRFVESSLGRAYPELRWRVEAVSLELPLSLVLRTIEGYGQKEDSHPLMRVEVLTVQPQVIESLRGGSVQAGYRMAVGKGEVAGRLRLRPGREGLHVEGTARDVKLAEVPVLSRHLNRTLQGSVAATFAADIVRGKEGGLSLEARVQMENGRVGLQRPILGHAELPFSLGSVILHGHGKTLQLEQGLVESELFDGRFAGAVTMASDLVPSQVDIKGAIQPKNKFFKGLDNTVALQSLRMQLKESPLPFRITGDLSSPGIHYEGFAMLVQTLEKELK